MPLPPLLRGLLPRALLSCRYACTVAIPAPGVVSIAFPAHPARRALFHGIWLRDHCPTSSHPLTGQRTLDSQTLPLALSPTRAYSEGDTVCLEWPGGHRSAFSSAWLQRYAYWWDGEAAPSAAPQPQPPPPPPPPESAPLSVTAWWRDAARDTATRRVWAAGDLAGGLPSVPYSAFMGGNEGLRTGLRLLRDVGFVLLQGCPATEAATEAACQRIGFLQPTLYGPGMWRTEVRPPAAGLTDTAYTADPLPLHTDGNYLSDAPGLQVFHCTQFDASGGGDSSLMDGLALAARVAAVDAAAFSLLTLWPFHYHHTGQDGTVGAARPVFGLDERGEVESVHYSSVDRGPVTLPPSWMRELALARALTGAGSAAALAVHPTLANPATAIPAMYAALRVLAECLSDPALLLRFPLRPGTVLIFNNQRVLHGRMGFDVTSGRVLVGCYLGKNEWMSRTREAERGDGSM
jgi:alpha-ketoglutarate-dependent taurine dioxygenase